MLLVQVPAATAETQLIYTDMLQAYEAGKLKQARALARRYLGTYLGLLPHDAEASLGLLIGIERSILAAENLLPPEDRLGGRSELFDQLRTAILATRDACRAIESPSPQQAFNARELRTIARDWLLAQSAFASRDELERGYLELADELGALGLDSLDAVLQPPAPPAPPTRVHRQVGAEEAAQLTALFRDYFTGLVNGDTALLARATSSSRQECEALLQALEEDLRDEGIRSIQHVHVPDLPAGVELVAAQAGGTFGLVVDGIVFDLVLDDGTTTTRTIRKHLRLRSPDKSGNGRWSVVADH